MPGDGHPAAARAGTGRSGTPSARTGNQEVSAAEGRKRQQQQEGQRPQAPVTARHDSLRWGTLKQSSMAYRTAHQETDCQIKYRSGSRRGARDRPSEPGPKARVSGRCVGEHRSGSRRGARDRPSEPGPKARVSGRCVGEVPPRGRGAHSGGSGGSPPGLALSARTTAGIGGSRGVVPPDGVAPPPRANTASAGPAVGHLC